MMDLPRDMEKTFGEEVSQYKKEKQMPYVTSYERYLADRALERGLEQGVKEGEIRGWRAAIVSILEKKFGSAALDLLSALEGVIALTVLRDLLNEAQSADTLDEFRQRLASQTVAGT